MAERRSKKRRTSRGTKRPSRQGLRTAEALWESEGRFRTLAESAPIGIFVTKPTGECFYTNPAWSAISGLTAEESLGYGWQQAIDPTELKRVKQSWGDAVAQKKDYAIDYRVVTPAGDVRWVHAMATPQVTASAKVVSYVGVIEDITDRKRAEVSLRESERMNREHYIELDQIYRTAPIGLALFDRDLRFVRINDRLAEINGLTVEQHLGRALPEVLPELWPALEPILLRVLAGDPVLDIEIHGVTPAHPGVERDWLSSYYPVRADDGAVRGVNVVVQEVTERKHAEQKARDNLRRVEALRAIEQAITSSLDLRSVLQVLLEKIELFLPIVVAGTVRLVNRESGTFEYLASRGIDESQWDADRAGARSRKIVATKAPLAVLNVHTDALTYNHDIFRKHGLVSYLGVPLIAKGEVYGVLSLYTKQEHAFNREEIDLLTTLANQTAIAIQNAQLYEQTKKHAVDLEKSNKVKDEFLSVMSHELRTPLSVVTGYVGMIKDRLLGEISDEQDQALEKVLSRASDQLAMINDILQTAQIEARVVALNRQPVDLGEFLDQLKSDYDVRADRKHVRLAWNNFAEAAVIQTDRAKLQQVLQNLINNALKFTASGTVTVTARVIENDAETRGHRDAENAASPGRWVEVEVADTGIGIPAGQIRSIFDKFFQVDSSETRHYGGVGLGLYIVKRFTDLLGGEIGVQSEPGKGTTFTLRIPA